MATSRSFHRTQRLHMRRWAAIAAAALMLSTLLAFFGSRVVSAVGDLTVRVYTDSDRDGQYDSGEPGVSGVPVSVYNTDNNLLFSVNTNASGLAIFPNTPNGDYRVEVTNPGNGAPNGTVISLPGSTTPGQDNALVFFVTINNAPVQRDVGLRSLDASGVDTGAPAGYRTIVVRAWDDRDANGIQDAGEPGINGLTLGLYNPSDVLVATATTGPDGTYRFVDTVPANVNNYTIRVTGGIPAGYVLTTQNANFDSEDRRDSDAYLSAGQPRINVPNQARGVNDDSLDVGFSRGAVSGFVWRDLDQNGLRDPGEPFINGVTVELRDSSDNLIGIPQTTRSILNDPFNRAGFFEFTSVPLTATYRVRIPSTEFDQSTDLLFGHATPQTQTVSLPQIGNQGLRNGTDPGPVVIGTGDFLQTPDFTLDATNRRNETSNFGLYAGTVGDFVWHDVNRNGIVDPLETTLGLANALVFIDLNSDCLINTGELTTTTDLNGYYLFDSLPLGVTYTVVLDASNFAPGGALEGLGYTTGAACGSNEGVFITMTTALTATAPSFLNADFGIARAEIGNFVWEDDNGNGIFDPSESGVPSVTVQLYGAGSDNTFFTTDDVPVGLPQTTNASGIYTITDILSGTYYATFDLSALSPDYVASVYTPTGWLSVDPLAQSSDDVNDVRAFVSGRVWRTPTFTITRGSQNPGVDAAVFRPVPITGAVRFDRDGDNDLFADNEPGMQGVTVTLWLSNSVVLTTTTDATGAYTFTNVTPAISYTVRVTNPDTLNFELVTPAGGDNDMEATDGGNTYAETAPFTVTSGATISGLSDAAVRGRATVTGQVWEDLNGNGQRDAGEGVGALPNVPVTLTVTVNLPGLLSTTITTNTVTSGGFYTFTALPGWANASNEVSFTLGFATPSGWFATLTDVGTQPATNDSDGSGTGVDQLDNQPLQRNTTETRDRGYYRPAVIQVRVFEENPPVDNIYAAGDAPLTATITLTPNVVLSGPSAQDATGIITYTVAPTTTAYVIGVTTPSGYTPSPGNTGTLTVTAPLTSNTTFGPLEFGYFQAGTVTGAVRFDRDGDNVLFADNEPGMQGVTVTLWLSNSVVLTTTTDATGAYTFTNVTPAVSYTVRVTNPDTLNFELVTPAGGDNDMATTDGGNTYAETSPFSVTAGATVGGLSDAAVRGRATVTGQVWEDLNGNGQRDAGETVGALPNVPVTLTVTVNLPGRLSTTITTNTTTNASGFYTFTALPGWANASTEVSFTLDFATPSGWFATLADVGAPATDSDGSGTGPDQLDDQGLQRNTTATRDRGYYRPAVIQVRVFEEVTLPVDNQYASGDLPLTATITLTPNVVLSGPSAQDATGIITYTVAPTTTDYVIGVTTPAGYSPSPGNTGTLTVTAPLTSNTTYGPLDFGYFQAGTVTGAVRFDRDGDNDLFADNEPGMQGVTVTLRLGGSDVLTTTTDATGAYTFTNVPPANNYSVRVINPDPTNFLLVTPAAGDNDLQTPVGDDADTAAFNVAPGATVGGSSDAAVRGRATVTGQVWEDLNGNGQRDAGETVGALPNVPVTLTVTVNLPGLLSTTITTNTTTNASGFYTFTALPGWANASNEVSFTLGFATPSGWFDTLADVGAPATDSDGSGTGPDQLDDQALERGDTEIRDRGYYRPAVIQVRVFEENPPVDNVYAAGDAPLSATITLTPNVVLSGPSAQDATGIITYTVAPTTTAYVIGVTTPSGYSPSPGNTGTLTVTAPLTSNTTYGPLDFGYFQAGTVTGAVRFDRDGDNVLFADNEPGMQGVTVTLWLSNSVVLTTTTDATGAYTFTNVTPAVSYTVRVTNPDTLNFELVTPAGGDNDMATTDGGNTYAETSPFSVTAGATVGGLSDAAVRGRATVTGQVWEDLNGNGQRDAGETVGALPNVPVTLTVTVNLPGRLSTTITTNTTTNASGFYTFTALPGWANASTEVSFTLDFATPSGWFATLADVGAPATDSDGSGTGPDQLDDQGLQRNTTATRDRGYYRPAVIQVRVFEEVTLPVDNQYASGDLPLTATITLTPNVVLSGPSAQDATGIITYTVAPTTTDYVIGVTTPAGYSPSPGNTGTLTVTAPLTSNTTYGPLDFGYFQAGTVTGAVRFDRDGDNDLFADNEPGMQGVTVTLWLSNSVVLTTTTDATGAYTFTNVTPNISYTVRVTNPDTLNFLLVTPAGGDNDMATTDGGNTYAETAPFTVTSGAAISRTAAVRGRATVTGQVWEDLNGNGQRDAGETVGALPGVTVNLTVTVNLPGLLSTTITTNTVTSGGFYTFTALPGWANASNEVSFTLGFATPSGWFATLPDVGAPATDSDGSGTGVDQLDNQPLQRNTTETRDRGYYRPAVIQVRVFEENPPVDNIYAAGDAPLTATITLTPNVVLSGPSAQDATGIITYTVAPTTTDYVIGVTTPAGYSPSPGNTGTLTVTAPLTSNTTYGPLEFGYFQAGTVTGAVRFDRDGDNVLFADTEPGMQGVTVTLRLGGSDVLTTTTDATGAYTFTNVTPNISYTVRVTNPDTLNFLLVTPAGGDNDMATTDGGNTYAETAPFTVTSGAAISRTAAVRGRATVTGQVWEDLNGNGQRDAGETVGALPGVTVNLTVTVNLPGLLSTTITTNTTTNASGFYTFTALPGWANASTEVSFTLGFATPSGWFDTLADVGAPATDSDGSGTGPDQLDDQGLQRNTTATRDRGYYRPAVIQVRVFEETTPPINNGYAAGDAPIAGATVALTPNVTLGGPFGPDATGIISYTVTPTTTAYTVGVASVPAGYFPSPGNTGTATAPAPLISGQTISPLPFGYYRNGVISGTVWFDANVNGTFNTGEPTMAGVTVTLHLDPDATVNGNETLIGTFTTGDNGIYQFTNITPTDVLTTGTLYRVRFELPTGYVFTTQGAPITTDNNSDADTTNGYTDRFSVGSNETVTYVDAGAVGNLSLSGTTWEDTDADGTFDAGETGLSGVTLTLTVTTSINSTNPTVTYTVTSGAGSPNFTFNQLPAGNYQLSVIAKPLGYLLSTAGTLSGTLPATGQNFGFYRTAAVGDRVWLDVNGNGTYDTSVDAGLPGVTVRLRDAATDVVISTTTTLAGGNAGFYGFENVTPGSYVVEFVVPTGFQTVNNGAGSLSVDNDNDAQSNGRTASFTLASNQISTTVDAGLVGSGSISGIAWIDENFDDIRNPGETQRIPGVQVTLTITPTVLPAPLTLSTTTNASGVYTFTNLPPGTFVLTFTKPAGYFDITPRVGSDPTVDSDAPVATGTLSAGQSITTLDAGYRTQTRVFLPLIMAPATPPDLVVEAFTVTPAKSSYAAGEPVLITVKVKNVGGSPTTIGFWVDFYINPSTPPTTPNVRWNDVCGISPCYGIAWYVNQSLAPGQSITLTSAPGQFAGPQSVWPGSFASGTNALYVYVDSYNPPVPTGAVVESNETNNRAQITGFVVAGASFSNGADSGAPSGASDAPVALPPRELPGPVEP
jgi:hypothetical protein